MRICSGQHTKLGKHTCACVSIFAGLSTGALAAAIAVPVAVVLAALLLACCCIRRRNLRRRAAAQAQALRDSKDLEASSVLPLPSHQDDAGSGRVRDQYDPRTQVCLALAPAQQRANRWKLASSANVSGLCSASCACQ